MTNEITNSSNDAAVEQAFDAFGKAATNKNQQQFKTLLAEQFTSIS